LPARSMIFCPMARSRLITPLYVARLPPLTVISYRLGVICVTALIAAVVVGEALMLKSVRSTFCTFLLKVARKTNVVALVGELDGLWRVKESKVGGIKLYSYAPISTIALPSPFPSTMRGLPSRSVVTLEGTSVLFPVSIAGEPGRRRRLSSGVPTILSAPSASTKSGSLLMLPVPE